jgi:uncharacterized HAD superfamily protein
MKIGIDIDEVIAEFLESFLDFYNLKYNGNFKKEDFKDYKFEEILGGTPDKTNELIQEHGYCGEIRLVEGALAAVNELSRKHELIVLTARHPMFKDKTEDFLAQHFGNIFSQILYTGEVFQKYGTTKSDLCRELGIDIIIEDNKLFSKECAEKGIRVLLFDKPWNQVYEEHKNINRVKNWKEILEKIKEEEINGICP